MHNAVTGATDSEDLVRVWTNVKTKVSVCSVQHSNDPERTHERSFGAYLSAVVPVFSLRFPWLLNLAVLCSLAVFRGLQLSEFSAHG